MLFFLSIFAEAIETQTPKPPVAKVIPKITELHGDRLVDNYAWLREKDNPETIAYLNAENAYAEAMTKRLKPFEEALYKEMLSRIKETDASVPTKRGDYFYYVRTEEGKQYPIHCRKFRSLDAPEEILIDENALAEGKPYFDLGLFNVSDDHNLLAYAVDETGYREYKLFFKDLRTGELLKDDVGYVVTFQWASDNKTFFYTIEDEAKRSYRLYRRELGAKEGALVYEEPDGLYSVYVSRSRDRRFIFLNIRSKTTSEVRFVRSDAPKESFRIICPRESEHKYSVEHRNGEFFIVSNKNAKNYRVLTAPVSDPSERNWKELIAHRPDALIEDLDVFANHLVLTVRENGLTQFEIFNFKTQETKRVAFPEPTYSTFGASNPEFETTKFRYDYQSLVSPSSIYECDMDSGESVLLKRQDVLGGYDPSDYVSERLWATASDGAKIPISIVYKKGFKRDGSSPLWLYGYGAYGIATDATFSSSRLSLLNRGVAFAIAHVRGGNELGEAWRDAGKMMNKKNTFTDFIACAEHLFKENYTSPSRLAIQGASAGGLLIGAVLNMRPDICRAAHLGVPFVDVLNTMLDESLPLTIGEFLEWGNPKAKAEYDYIKSYCPYSNLARKHYPNILVTTSLNDSQVGYWEPAKYVAKLRALKTDSNLLLLKINMDAGHSGASGRYDYLKELAFEYAVMLSMLGIER
ncbi:MAG: S9 family peptidase [Chloroherpetonaceae bacterium]|nr:S9 family peptidase [Chloroherpetonaceae bacterium]